MIRHVIWDWNGTLIDDVDLCVDILNRVLIFYQKPTLTVSQYREFFFFPVSEFYQVLGLPSHGPEYDKLANDYISLYRKRFTECNLHKGALITIQYLHSIGVSQSILTAGMQADIEKFAFHYNITGYFQSIDGANNTYAKGKLDRIITHFQKLRLDPSEVILVGDTLHDWEISKHINCQVYLFSKGHINEKRLSEAKAPILNSLTDLKNLVRD